MMRTLLHGCLFILLVVNAFVIFETLNYLVIDSRLDSLCLMG